MVLSPGIRQACEGDDDDDNDDDDNNVKDRDDPLPFRGWHFDGKVCDCPPSCADEVSLFYSHYSSVPHNSVVL